jgi:beta-mannosidase
MDFSGKVFDTQQGDATLPPLSSTRVAEFTDAQLLAGVDPRTRFAVFEWLDGDKPVSRQLVFFDDAKHLRLPSPPLRTQLAPSTDGYTLTLSSDALVRDVWVSFGKLDVDVSDNAFDLLPGESVTLTVHAKADLEALRQALEVQHLAAVMAGAAE